VPSSVIGQWRGGIELVTRALARNGWQYATAVLVIVIAVEAWRVISQPQTPSSQTGAATSQLIQVADELMKVVDKLHEIQASVASSNDEANSIKAELAIASKKPEDVRRRLDKPAPPARQRN